ncbi:MAG: hypothetical protein Q7V20_18545 [Aquabacterium sp.]|uniref:hypothetical protein n=1 Tax=Aquabacterium sp. TaxID=1872578 RepID=UPI002721D425|nr:hypothetical protein [Aquabacterium sp.]MDO9005449.1 hypothetical protein [Aquabacterium sp.]
MRVADLRLNRHSWCVAVLGAVAILGATSAWAAPVIYSCDDGKGHKLTSDRPIQECLDREQRLLNKDGSHRQTVPPRMTAEEMAVYEDQQRLKAVKEAARKDAVRRDRNLMLRFPNEAAHNKGRVAALDDLRKAIAISEKRVAELQADRKTLATEAEFFQGKAMPFKLRSRIEDNEATQQAQRDIIVNQKAEMVRINALYDAELARLRRLWAGAPLGSQAATPASAAR